jgi:hypothetical protein
MSDEADAADERIHACIDRIAAGDLVIAAVARGEVVDPTVLDSAADAMAEILADHNITGAIWTMVDVERVRQLRALLTSAAPSPEARAAAAEGRLIFDGAADEAKSRAT